MWVGLQEGNMSQEKASLGQSQGEYETDEGKNGAPEKGAEHWR